MKKINDLNVLYHKRRVGRLVLYKDNFAVFEYDKEWIGDGFSISPFSLPLIQKVFIPKQAQTAFSPKCKFILRFRVVYTELRLIN